MRVWVGSIASILTAAGGTLWPSPIGLLLVALGVITNAVLIGAMGSAIHQANIHYYQFHKLADDLHERDTNNFRMAAASIRSILANTSEELQ